MCAGVRMKNCSSGMLERTHASRSFLLNSHLLPTLLDGIVPSRASSYSAVLPSWRYRAVSSIVSHSSLIDAPQPVICCRMVSFGRSMHQGGLLHRWARDFELPPFYS